MNVFDNKEYEIEANERFGNTDAYIEYAEKTAGYDKIKWQQVNDGLNVVLSEFAVCMQSGHTADSDKVQILVNELKMYITDNYYTCNNEILKGLGKMYVADERFKANIDKHAVGTAEFVSKAIEFYCK